MPPWAGVPATPRRCEGCGGTFLAKRASARWCRVGKCREAGRTAPRSYNSVASKKWRTKRLQQPGYRDRINTLDKLRSAHLKQWLRDYKVRVGCVDCGFNAHHAALDFDHVGPVKNRPVSSCKSRQQAEDEIALCEVRCANCHRIKTQERIDARRAAGK